MGLVIVLNYFKTSTSEVKSQSKISENASQNVKHNANVNRFYEQNDLQDAILHVLRTQSSKAKSQAKTSEKACEKAKRTAERNPKSAIEKCFYEQNEEVEEFSRVIITSRIPGHKPIKTVIYKPLVKPHDIEVSDMISQDQKSKPAAKRALTDTCTTTFCVCM